MDWDESMTHQVRPKAGMGCQSHGQARHGVCSVVQIGYMQSMSTAALQERRASSSLTLE